MATDQPQPTLIERVAHLLWQVNAGYILAEDRAIGTNWFAEPPEDQHVDDQAERPGWISMAEEVIEALRAEVASAGPVEALAEALCDQFAGMIHNQSDVWTNTPEGTRAWWREQATGLLGRIVVIEPGELEKVAAAARRAEYERDDARRNEARANGRMVTMRDAVMACGRANRALRQALRLIASEDYRGPRPRSIDIAKAALAGEEMTIHG
jgi:hypothetical protein